MDREIAYAKINLALHVRRRRPDNYHDIETIFAFCADGDQVEARAADALSLIIEGPFASGLETQNNLVMRAASSMAPGRGVALTLTKNLPVAAGIGGGSADAAATLRLLARTWKSDADLGRIASILGADVPACLASTTARGEGRGDALAHSSEALTGTPVLLVNPGIPLSTADVFQAWDGVDRGPLGDWRDGRNDLAAAAQKLVPEIAVLVGWLCQQPGTTLARMSGSGATCFALFDSIEARKFAANELSLAFPTYWTLQSVLR